MEDKTFDLCIIMTNSYIYRCLAKDVEISNGGNTITYTELGQCDTIDWEKCNMYSEPRYAMSSGCPFKLIEHKK